MAEIRFRKRSTIGIYERGATLFGEFTGSLFNNPLIFYKECIMKRITLLCIGLMLLAGCATGSKNKPVEASQPTTAAAPQAKTGFLDGYYDKLQPGPKDGAKLRWLKPGADFKKYNKLMVDSVIFFLSHESGYKGIDGNEMKELTDAFNLELANALQDKYSIVCAPGPDVLRIQIAITDIKLSKPGMSAVTSIIPVGLACSVVKKGATDSWAGSGEVGVELLAKESTTNEVVAAAKDKKSAGFTERFSKSGSAKEAFKYWAGKIRSFMDKAQGI